MVEFSKNIVESGKTIKDALIQLNDLPDTLTLFVVDKQGTMIGTLTDGDARRGFIKGYLPSDKLDLFMSKNFNYIQNGNVSTNEIRRLKLIGIKLLPLLDEKKKILKIYNLLKIHNILPVDVVLMAGGRGERLRPLTDSIPKPLLKVGNKPIIEHNIDNHVSYGIENFHISVNYLANQIIDYFGNGSSKEISINYVREDKPLGTIGAVSLIKEFRNDVILVMNSDLFTNLNYEDFYNSFIKEDADMSIASIPYNISIPYAILNINNDLIKSFEEKPTYTYYANAGIYLIKKTLLSSIPVNQFFNATDLIQLLIAKNCKVIKYPIMGYWVDIGRHEDYTKVQEFSKHLTY